MIGHVIRFDQEIMLGKFLIIGECYGYPGEKLWVAVNIKTMVINNFTQDTGLLDNAGLRFL